MSVVERKTTRQPDAEVSAIEKKLVLFRGNLESEYKLLEVASQGEIASAAVQMDAMAARTLEKAASGWVEKEERAQRVLSDMEVSLHDLFDRFRGDIAEFDCDPLADSFFEITCVPCKTQGGEHP